MRDVYIHIQTGTSERMTRREIMHQGRRMRRREIHFKCIRTTTPAERVARVVRRKEPEIRRVQLCQMRTEFASAHSQVIPQKTGCVEMSTGATSAESWDIILKCYGERRKNRHAHFYKRDNNSGAAPLSALLPACPLFLRRKWQF
jgi:hypothetical protein